MGTESIPKIKEEVIMRDRRNVSRMERVQMGYTTEELIAQIYKGKTTPHNYPVDVITRNLGIEVKSFDKAAKEYKCRMALKDLKAKERWCKRNKRKAKTIMVIIAKKAMEVYEREGFGNWRVENMEYVGTF